MKIKGYESKEPNNTITKLDKWYDRLMREYDLDKLIGGFLK